MPVIINDFEVDTQATANGSQASTASPAAPAAQQSAPPAPALKPQDIWLIVRHRQARLRRLRAH